MRFWKVMIMYSFYVKLERHLQKMFYLLEKRPFKYDEKYFLFHLENSFVLKTFKILS